MDRRECLPGHWTDVAWHKPSLNFSEHRHIFRSVLPTGSYRILDSIELGDPKSLVPTQRFTRRDLKHRQKEKNNFKSCANYCTCAHPRCPATITHSLTGHIFSLCQQFPQGEGSTLETESHAIVSPCHLPQWLAASSQHGGSVFQGTCWRRGGGLQSRGKAAASLRGSCTDSRAAERVTAALCTTTPTTEQQVALYKRSLLRCPCTCC